jgi:hypothetical protein
MDTGFLFKCRWPLVKDPVSCLLDHFAFASLDSSYIWSVDFCKLVESSRPVGMFLPSKQSIVSLVGSHEASSEFWPCKTVRRQKIAHDGISDHDDLHDAIDDVQPDDEPGSEEAPSEDPDDEGVDGNSDHDSEHDLEPCDSSSSASHDVDDDIQFSDDELGGWGAPFDDLGALVEHDAPIMGASGSMGPPPVPLPPPAPHDPALSQSSIGSKKRADVVIPYLGGTIKYYSKTKRFEVKCEQPGHGNLCRLSRVSRASLNKNNVAQGRIIGLAGSWLSLAATFESHAEHISPLSLPLNTHALRSYHREQIARLPGVDELFAGEAPHRGDGPQEPLEIP